MDHDLSDLGSLILILITPKECTLNLTNNLLTMHHFLRGGSTFLANKIFFLIFRLCMIFSVGNSLCKLFFEHQESTWILEKHLLNISHMAPLSSGFNFTAAMIING